MSTPRVMLTEYIERLRKRRDYLSVRIEKGTMDGKNLSYDKAEFATLDYSIAYLLSNEAAALDFMRQWLSEKQEK